MPLSPQRQSRECCRLVRSRLLYLTDAMSMVSGREAKLREVDEVKEFSDSTMVRYRIGVSGLPILYRRVATKLEVEVEAVTRMLDERLHYSVRRSHSDISSGLSVVSQLGGRLG